MDTFSQSFSHFPHHRQRAFGVENPAIDYQAAHNPSLPPLDMALIVSNEAGVIEFCNIEAQSLFYCSSSCESANTIENLFTAAPCTNAFSASTLWEIARASRRPVALSDVFIPTHNNQPCQMDICTAWLNETREGYLRIVFIFSHHLHSPQQTRSSACSENTSDKNCFGIVQKGIIIHKHYLIIETSTSFETMTNYKEDDLIGRDISSLMTDISAEHLIHSIKTHNTSEWDGLIIQPDKFLLPVSVRSFPLIHLDSDVVISLFYTVPELKQLY